MVVQGGFGVVVKIDVGTVLTALTKVVDMDYPALVKVLAESTTHDSTAGYQEWIATGKRTVDAFSCTLTWDTGEATHAAIVTVFDADAAVSFSINDPDSDETLTFEGHIGRMQRETKQEDVYKCDVEIQPTGQVSIT